jgi:DNA-binding protein YbaB
LSAISHPRAQPEGITLTANLHPDIPEIVDGEPGAALLREAQRLRSAWDGYRNQLATATFTGTDEGGSVEATVNGNLQLTGLRIEDGLLRHGVEAVGQRINEALQKAVTVAARAFDSVIDPSQRDRA